MRLQMIHLVPAAILVLGSIGCKKTEETGETDTSETGDTTETDTEDTEDTADHDGHPRMVHLSADLAAPCDHDSDTATDPAAACLDLYIAGSNNPLNTAPFPFGASTAYPIPFAPATYTFRLFSTGDDPTSDTPVMEPQITLEEATWKTLVVYGMNANSTLGSIIVDDDPSAPTAGTSRVRLFQASLGAAAAQVDLKLDSTVVADDLTFGHMSTAAEVTAGSTVAVQVDIGAPPDGTTDWVGQIVIADGKITDLFMIDTGDGTYPFMLLAHDTTTNTPVQVPLVAATR